MQRHVIVSRAEFIEEIRLSLLPSLFLFGVI